MLAYLIDPKHRSVTPVDTEGDCSDIYKLLECSTFEIHNRGMHLAGRDALYVDETARLKPDPELRGLFRVRGFHSPIIGKALLLGHTADGDTTSAKTHFYRLKQMIAWETRN